MLAAQRWSSACENPPPACRCSRRFPSRPACEARARWWRSPAETRLTEPHRDEVIRRGCRAITRTDAKDLDLSLRARDRAAKADRQVIVAVIRLGGGRSGRCPAKLA